ncbi:T9SS type A sorting domain-containing protein [Bacteroidota bacterium]
MKKIVVYLSVLICAGTFLFIKSYKQKKTALAFDGNEAYMSANLQNRAEWELHRLVDPLTGKIPPNMYYREMKFAENLPTDAGFNFFRSDVWVHRGPFNVGGRTRAAALDIANENIIFAGGVSGGLWRSVNAGQNWTKITPTNQFLSISTIAQDKRSGKTNIWYYGTGEAYGNSAGDPGAYFYGNGVYKSTDNGLSWQALLSTVTNNTVDFDPWDIIWRITTDPSNDTQDVVYAAALRRLFKSTDGGQNWTLELGGTNGSYFTDVAVSSTGVVYATMSSDGSHKGIWRSADGTNWINILPLDTFPSEYDRIVLEIDPNNEDVVWFLAHTPGSGKMSLNYRGNEDWNSLWKYRYLKGDGAGANGKWNNLSENIPSVGTKSFDNFNAQGSYNLVVRVMPGDTNVVFIAGTNIYRSTDAFSSSTNTVQLGGYGVGTKRPNWTVYPNHHPDQHELLFLPSDPKVLINGNDGGMFRTENALASTLDWTSLNNGYLTTQLYTINMQDDESNDILIAGLQDNGNLFVNSSSSDADWVLPLNGDGSYSAIAKNRDFYILSTQLGKMAKMKLDDKGERITFARIDPMFGKNYQFINPFVLDPNDNNLLYLAEGYHLWRNDSITHIPYAENYDSIKTGWFLFSDSVKYPNRSISAISVSKKNPSNRLYIGTSGSILYRVDDANVDDPTMTRISSLVNPGNVSCMAIDPNDADKVMVVFSNYKVYSLFYSEDGGTSWTKVAGNLEENLDGTGDGPSLRWAEIMHVKDKTLYLVGTSVGLFGTDLLDGTSTEWIQLGSKSIGNVVVDMVKTRELDGTIVVATHGNGVYSAKINSVEDVLGTDEERNTLKPAFRIFPNPIQNQLTILSQGNNRETQFSILNMEGKVLIKGTLSGNITSLNAQELKPGNYFILLQNDNEKRIFRFLKM